MYAYYTEYQIILYIINYSYVKKNYEKNSDSPDVLKMCRMESNHLTH